MAAHGAPETFEEGRHMDSDPFAAVAPVFAEMANQMIYCTLATVDRRGRPRSRMVHSLWEWDGDRLLGWVGSVLTPLKRAHLSTNPYVSCGFWNGAEAYDTCTAECRAELLTDAESRRTGWDRFVNTPPPLGYNPAEIIPEWAQGPDSPTWCVIRLEPWHLHVCSGEFARSGGATGHLLNWQAAT